MYVSPINAYLGEVTHKLQKDAEEKMMLEVQQAVGFTVDRDELIRALRYDRDQYEKGYDDAKHKYEKMLDKLAEFLESLQIDVPCDCLAPIRDECEICHFNAPTKGCWIKWAENEEEK